MAVAPTDPRRVTAERNTQAVLDAAERLLQGGDQATIAAVAKEAGVSRVTVYAHFDTREELLEAVVGRAVARAGKALRAAKVDAGTPSEALRRLVVVSWQELEKHHAIARAAAADLSPAALRRSHSASRAPFRKLIKRGRVEGDFRDDVPEDWLVTVVHALMHAAVEEVRERRLKPETAGDLLAQTIVDFFRRPAA